MRLSTKLALAASVAAISAIPAAPAHASHICVMGPHYWGEICAEQVVAIALDRKACVDAAVAASDTDAAIACAPRTITLP